MLFLDRLRSFWNWLLHRNAIEKELEAEVKAFYEVVVQRHVEKGLPVAEARRLARLQFDSPESVKEQVRDARPGAAIMSLSRTRLWTLFITNEIRSGI